MLQWCTIVLYVVLVSNCSQVLCYVLLQLFYPAEVGVLGIYRQKVRVDCRVCYG